MTREFKVKDFGMNFDSIAKNTEVTTNGKKYKKRCGNCKIYSFMPDNRIYCDNCIKRNK